MTGAVTLPEFPSGPEKDSGFAQAVTLRMLAGPLTCSRRRRSRRPRPGPPRQLSARAAGPGAQSAAGPPAFSALRTESLHPLAPWPPHFFSSSSPPAASTARSSRLAGATGQPRCRGPRDGKPVTMEMGRAPAAVKSRTVSGAEAATPSTQRHRRRTLPWLAMARVGRRGHLSLRGQCGGLH